MTNTEQLLLAENERLRYEVEELQKCVQELREDIPKHLRDLPNEIWRDVVGCEGLYKVSNLGRVKSLMRNGVRMLNPCENGGYLKVSLHRSGKHAIGLVHVLVARAFVPNPENKPQVNHIDGNKLNNNVSNLEWVTESENTRHAWRMGLGKTKRGAESPRAKLTLEQVNYIRSHYITGDRTFGSKGLARKFGVTDTTILNVVHMKTYKGVS